MKIPKTLKIGGFIWTVEENEKVMHALWWQAGLNSRYKKDENKFEEEIVDALSNGLYQVLKDNAFLK